VLAFTNPLADSSGKRLGKVSVGCIPTTGARNFLKSTVTNGAITGGTGAYANASGEFTSKQAEGGAVNTITLGQ
jgi:hypothetical protein